MHPEDTVVDVNGIKIGGGHFQVIAGPCSVESKEQMEEVASDVKASGATLLRGGAFKPRTSPYSFQGLHENGLALLCSVLTAENRSQNADHRQIIHCRNRFRHSHAVNDRSASYACLCQRTHDFVY